MKKDGNKAQYNRAIQFGPVDGTYAGTYFDAGNGSNYCSNHFYGNLGRYGSQVCFGAIQNNQWYHFTILANGTNAILYLNGNQVASTTISGNTQITGIQLGGEGSADTAIMGSIDGAKIFSYARTPAQVAWDYNRGAPIAQYDFNECSGTILHDSAPKNDRSGTFYNGTITPNSGRSAGTCASGVSTEMWNGGTNGKYGGSLALDGAGDSVAISNAPGTNLSTTLTLSTWFKTTAAGNTQALIGKWNSGAVVAGRSYRLAVVGGKIWASTSADGASAYTYSGSTTLSSNTWYHAVFTYDTVANSAKLYLDGKLDSSTTTNGAAYVSNKGICIGSVDNSNNNSNTCESLIQFFSGQIDGVRIYNYALTGTQVKTLYNENSAVRFGP